MSLQEKINADLKAAMIGGFKERRDLLRVVIGEIGRDELSRKVLPDSDVMVILKKLIENAKIMKNDLEISILSEYLPSMLNNDELEIIISDIITSNGFNSVKNMGAVMQVLKTNYHLKYDGKIASELIKKLLN